MLHFNTPKIMGIKTIHKNLDGSVVFTDTRTTEEAHEENLFRIRELVTLKITEAGYDEIWQRNAALGVIAQDEAEAGRAYIKSLRAAYHDYKSRLLVANRDEADAIQFVAPAVPSGL
jgi:hypothetical protein